MKHKKKTIGISILLIILGFIFLLDNLNFIDISVTELIRIYWPVIIIWIGIEKLIRDLR